MNRLEFIKNISEKTGFSKTDSEQALNAMINVITETVSSGESVKIVGFGSFEAAERSERVARNPRTGESINVSAKRVPVFKAGKEFKDAVNA